jgi:two-component system nitrate/nitrite response regulator NarL
VTDATIRIFIVADIRLYREGLARVLGAAPTLEVVGTAERAEEATRFGRPAPDIVVLDIATPGAFEAIRAINVLERPPRIVAVAVPDVEDDVLACAEAGIAGYVTRADSIATTIDVIESVARGELLTTPRFAAALLRRVSSLAAASPPAASARLTPREREIAELIGHGFSNKLIAQRLCIELPTVKNHVHNILEKLQVSRRADAALRFRALSGVTAVENGDPAN